jgi:hypothetical protein
MSACMRTKHVRAITKETAGRASTHVSLAHIQLHGWTAESTAGSTDSSKRAKPQMHKLQPPRNLPAHSAVESPPTGTTCGPNTYVLHNEDGTFSLALPP